MNVDDYECKHCLDLACTATFDHKIQMHGNAVPSSSKFNVSILFKNSSDYDVESGQ